LYQHRIEIEILILNYHYLRCTLRCQRLG